MRGPARIEGYNPLHDDLARIGQGFELTLQTPAGVWRTDRRDRTPLGTNRG